MNGPWNRGPLLSAGILLGAGLGGFADGILFHQILQVHNMLSGRIPVTDLVSAKVNMVWDGLFHAAVWILTCIGLALLFRAGRRRDVPWSGKTLLGSMLIGWGLFNLIEGVIDHEILGIHHVYEYTLDHLPADMAFLAAGAMFLTLGMVLVRQGRSATAPRGEARLAA
jgi:uncharacterized membrane protein